ncbi:DUF2634 domain-containing protein [Paenibacillus hamazuiensis]|uniref:DUF2634 domain-containing protein n=1 Tax=Paenibacillus hamazuiensis TaxID=2936508 RepID=UPI00200BF665|nr:DUF2634 domain-containing protein [Paenibacillus hamazuiensis]
MIPQGGILSSTNSQKVVNGPSKTYRFDIKTGRIRGRVDGLDAVKQAVYKILETERFQYLIYSSNYGFEFKDILGSDPLFFNSKITNRIQEALLQDDRIKAIENVQISSEGEEAVVQFTVVSTYGSFQIAKEV